MAQLSTKWINKKKYFYVDGKEVTAYQYREVYAQNKGYKNFYQLGVDKNYKFYPDKNSEEIFRFKEEHVTQPDGIREIPDIPGYYATAEGAIWHFSERRDRWIEISQQTQKSDYRVFQPYINGKRHVKYCHRAIHNAFYGEVMEGYEVHHRDGDKTNNRASNLTSLPKEEHRRMPRRPYKSRKR
jgi:hypothetical protein